MIILPLVANAEIVEIDGIWYNLISKAKVAEVTKPDYLDASTIYVGEVTIPHSIEYNNIIYDVTSIGELAFTYCNNLTSIIIPNSVTSIGGGAFWNCFALSSVSMSNSVTSIGDHAFYQCTSLTSIDIPNSVTHIGAPAFSTTALASVTIPNGVTGIEIGTFASCTSLTSITIPYGVVSIDDSAFGDCINLKSIDISNSVTSIGGSAFNNCKKLTSITIPNSVTYIGGGAFSHCSDLSSVVIPNSVTYIGELAFANCDNLEDVYCNAEIVPNTSTDAFNYSYIEYATLHVPAQSVNIYKTTEPWSKFKNVVDISKTPHILKYLVDDEDYETFQMYEGEAIIPLTEPSKEGYTFSGWSQIPTIMPANDVTVTGTFTINKYNLTYMVDDVEYKTYEVEYGSTITPEAEPTKEGYTFSGWSDIPETMPANDVTVTGTFTFIPFGKCATPSISMKNGKIIFECETEGVEYVPQVTPLNETSYSNGEMQLPNKYRITVYATKEKYENSDVATKDIELSLGSKGDVNGDGVVDAADVVQIANIIMGK